MQKLFLITGFISFLPPSPSSTSANVSKSEQGPNQFQVFRETQRGSSTKAETPPHPGPAPTLSICTARCTRARATLYVFCSQEGMAGWNQRWKPSRARTPSLGKVGASAGCGSSSTLCPLRARGPRATYLSEGAGPSWQSSFRMM